MIHKILEVKEIFSFPGEKRTASIAIVKTISNRSSNEVLRLSYYLNPKNASNIGGTFWELPLSINLAQAFRSLKLLGNCPVIDEDTLCACYYAMNESLNETAQCYIDSLKKSGFSEVETYRDRLLAEPFDKAGDFAQTITSASTEESKLNIRISA